jgi:hypothetical protein
VYFNLIQDWTTGLDITEQTHFTTLDEYKTIKAQLTKHPLAEVCQLP